MLADIVVVILGLLLLYLGAEGLVRGSVSLAFRLGMSSLAIGLTIVAYGTSMPEMVVSARAALLHQGAISVGNVVGSNIFNIAVILGISALINPLKVKLKIVKSDAPIMVGISLMFLLFFRDFRITRIEGVLLLAGIVIYTSVSLIVARMMGRGPDEPGIGQKRLKSIAFEIAFIIGGLLLLVFGSNLLVSGSLGIARDLGISEAVIALTIIAAGTSLPELATCVVASYRKEPDIAIGNIVGSNIFNILAILGASALISPIDGTGISAVDLLVMIGVSLALLPMLRTGFTLGRIEGASLLGGYAIYLGYLLRDVV